MNKRVLFFVTIVAVLALAVAGGVWAAPGAQGTDDIGGQRPDLEGGDPDSRQADIEATNELVDNVDSTAAGQGTYQSGNLEVTSPCGSAVMPAGAVAAGSVVGVSCATVPTDYVVYLGAALTPAGDGINLTINGSEDTFFGKRVPVKLNAPAGKTAAELANCVVMKFDNGAFVPTGAPTFVKTNADGSLSLVSTTRTAGSYFIMCP